MAVICLKCETIIGGADGLHLVSKCPNKKCNNTDKFHFRRCPDSIDPHKQEVERMELEDRRIT